MSSLYWRALLTDISRYLVLDFPSGIFSFYQVIVRELATDNRNQPVRAQDPESYKAENLYTYEEARKKKPQLVPYIAAEFHAKDFSFYQKFVVGNGLRSSKVSERRRKREENTTEYYNGPLEENTFYAVFQRAYVNKVGIKVRLQV